MKTRCLAAALALASLLPAGARAGAVFDSDAYAFAYDLTFTYAVGGGDATDDVVVAPLFGGDEPGGSVRNMHLEGQATGDSLGEIGALEALGATAFAYGESGPTLGYAEGFGAAFFDFLVVNVSETEAITFAFDYEIGAFSDASLSPDAPDVFYDAAAFGGALVYVDTVPIFENDGAPVDPDGLFDLIEAETDARFGPFGPQGAEGELTSFSFTLDPGETIYFTLEAYADGFALAEPVPLPAGLPLVGAALAALGLAARRRDRA
ncbi:MAG: hypothetical protein VYD87_05900 [Pseudomonadota bacterium]|nr:hypothetical protein [Pseudomonadota bacterium]